MLVEFSVAANIGNTFLASIVYEFIRTFKSQIYVIKWRKIKFQNVFSIQEIDQIVNIKYQNIDCFSLPPTRWQSLDSHHPSRVHPWLLDGDAVLQDHVVLVHHGLDFLLVSCTVRVIILIPSPRSVTESLGWTVIGSNTMAAIMLDVYVTSV